MDVHSHTAEFKRLNSGSASLGEILSRTTSVG
ncbi:hypothetical protein NOV72_01898 [Caballeronia novacaledonica]|uniref:Uncharacterized protein n=1 Tax=Caballeronia novacaledonica TaxID=1544861 RepID=A0A2U3I3F1_9BURK|nr:hypothetical protein NOV72_01898 [Caballeronia novacaledonica]